tara:strand:+ start:554 stop:862 length:309 start_codon:yes stop_codon:yes gene_type:complete
MICSYDLEFIHPRRGSLYNIINNYNDSVEINFSSSPKKKRGENFFYVKASVSCEETGNFLFTDVIQSLLEKNPSLEIGGTFMQPVGKGYVDSFGTKQYVELN